MTAATFTRSILSPARGAFSWARTVVLEAAFFAGLAAVAYGVAMIYLPAGVIAGGVALTACAFLEMRT